METTKSNMKKSDVQPFKSINKGSTNSPGTAQDVMNLEI